MGRSGFRPEALSLFLNNASLPVDENTSESALRAVTLGRKDVLFVGHDESGSRLAKVYLLLATCQADRLNPKTYLADVLLLRVQTQPAALIDELLPDCWKPRAPSTS